MKITRDQWFALIDACKAADDKWLAERTAKYPSVKDTFETVTGTAGSATGGVETLIRAHRAERYGRIIAHHSVIWETASGELRKAKAKIDQKRGGASFKVTSVDPKAWKNLASKSPEEMMKGLGLHKFTVLLGVTSTGTPSHMYRGFFYKIAQEADGSWASTITLPSGPRRFTGPTEDEVEQAVHTAINEAKDAE